MSRCREVQASLRGSWAKGHGLLIRELRLPFLWFCLGAILSKTSLSAPLPRASPPPGHDLTSGWISQNKYQASRTLAAGCDCDCDEKRCIALHKSLAESSLQVASLARRTPFVDGRNCR